MNTLFWFGAFGLRRAKSPRQTVAGIWQQFGTAKAEPPPTETHASAIGESTEDEIDYTISQKDFKWVERLFPPSRIPPPPKHDSYPTPSGWIASSEKTPNKPYFARRTRWHTLHIIEVEKPIKSKRWLTAIRSIEGDIMALEKELVEVVRPHLEFDPATRVHELTQTIWIKGLHKDIIEEYLYGLGF